MSNHALQSTSDPVSPPSDGVPSLPNTTARRGAQRASAAPVSRPRQHLTNGLPGASDPLGIALLRLRTADQTRPQTATFTTGDEQSEPDASDRRQFPRHRSSYVVSVWPRDGSGTTDALQNQPPVVIRGEMIDLSLNGIAIKLLKPLQPNIAITVNLRNPVNGHSLEVSGTVIRCLPGDGQEWKVVCCFAHHLSIEQLAQFNKSCIVSAP